MSTPFKDSHELYSGVLFKCGGKVKSWNKRFFMLKSDHCLYYYKDTSKGPLGIISLRDTKFSVRKGEPGNCTWPKNAKMECAIAVVTTSRTYFMYSMYAHEAEDWIRMLTKAKEKLGKETKTNNNRASSTSSIQTSTDKATKLNSASRALSDSQLPDVSSILEESANYEALYDAPEQVHRNSNSSKGSSSSNGKDKPPTPPNDTIDAIYDMAMPERSDSIQQLLYSDVPDESNQTHPQQPAATAGVIPNDEQDATYEDIVPVHTPQTQELYELLQPEPESSIQNTPLPAIPVASNSAPSNSMPLYEDLPGDTPQPLYEPIENADNEQSIYCEAVAGDSDDDGQPALPPKNDLPPLPPRENLPPLPPKEDSPPLPPKEDSPPLQDIPQLPPKEDIHQNSSSPPLPEKDDSVVRPVPQKRTPPSPRRTTPTNRPQPSPRHNVSTSTSAQPSNQPAPVPKVRVQESPDDQAEPVQSSRGNVRRGTFMFQSRKQQVDVGTGEDYKKRSESIRILENMNSDPTLSSEKRALFSETIREAEQERLRASEERFRWERERLKLEEERRAFEEEKRLLAEQLKQTKLQIQQS